MRAIAVLLVLFWHLPVPHAKWLPFRILEFPGATFGWAGVDMFFVLSGFLVGGLMMKEYARDRTIQTGRFLTRRASKIWPQYYVFVLFMVATHRSELKAYIPSFFALQNYLGSPSQHLWSLAVEEHFYLVLALTFPLLITKTLTPRKMGLVALVVALVCLGLRGLSLDMLPAHAITVDTHLRIDALLFGVFLASLWHLDRTAWEGLASKKLLLWGTLAAGVLSLSLMDKYSPAMLTIGLTLTFLGFGALLVLMLSARHPAGFWEKPYTVLAWIGERSYGIYLWQFLGSHLSDFAIMVCPPKR